MRAYNTDRYIGEAIKSFLSQTYENKELVIVEDCSPDNTAKIAAKFASKFDGIYFTDECRATKNAGAGKTFVKIAKIVLSRARPDDIIYVLDDDDKYLRDDALELLVSRMLKTRADVCFVDSENFGDVGLVSLDERKRNQAMIIDELSKLDKAKTIAQLNIIAKAHCGMCTRAYTANVFKRYIDLIPELTDQHVIGDDIMSLSSLLLRGLAFTSLAEPIYGYRRRGDSISKKFSRGFFLKNMLFLRTAKDMVLHYPECHVVEARRYLKDMLDIFRRDYVDRVAIETKRGRLENYSKTELLEDFYTVVGNVDAEVSLKSNVISFPSHVKKIASIAGVASFISAI